MLIIDTIGERIKTLRKSFHLSQTEFGSRLGVKQNTVATWESGVRIPSDVSIRSIAREFKANEEWLRNGTGKLDSTEARAQEIAVYMTKLFGGNLSDLQKELIDFMAYTSVDQWQLLLDIIRQLSDDVDKNKPPDT